MSGPYDHPHPLSQQEVCEMGLEALTGLASVLISGPPRGPDISPGPLRRTGIVVANHPSCTFDARTGFNVGGA